jgi:hypothetical protein
MRSGQQHPGLMCEVFILGLPPTSSRSFHIRGGRVPKVVNYFDRDRALATLGLAPADAVDSD